MEVSRRMEELAKLNDKQREAVLHEGSPLLILAGAGSGKTRVITTKISYLVGQKGVDPMSILAVTFTNKAANEMKRRVLSMAPGADGVMIRTFHSFGAWLLRRNSHLLDLNNNFTICDEDDSFNLLKRATGKRFEKFELRRYLRWIERAKDSCVSPTDDLNPISMDRIFPEIYRLYQEKLEASGKLDFGDLIMRSVELLQRIPEVKKRIQQRFRFILVDEYQDANTAQFLLLKELYRPGNYLCVVGDEDQSIYRFRGAEVRNILDFPEAFRNTEIIRLEQNYRSTQNILEAASRVVANNRERLGKNLWSDAGEGRFIGLAVVRDEREEALLCARLLDDGNYEDTAILYRNNYQSRIFETVFSRFQIPFRLIGSLRFAEREEVKDGLAYAAFVLNQKDEVAFMRIVNKPSRGIGRTSLEKITAHLGGEGRSAGGDYLQACRAALPSLTGKAGKGLSGFVEMAEALRSEMPDRVPAEFFERMLRTTGLYEHYRERDRLEETNRTQNLDELVNAAVGYSRGIEGLSEFLESLELNSTDEDPYERKHAVNLITMHNTKGLEFSRVIVTGMEDGLIPYYRDDSERDVELEEERRLFYVAMTRAKSELILTACRRRQVFGMYKNRRLSRFLSEIPQHLLTTLTPDTMDPWGGEEESEFTEGCGIYHAQYGPGVITRKWHDGKHTLVTAHFSSGKTGKFILKYAGLERISLDD